MKKLLFIHRSVGENLIVEGALYNRITAKKLTLEDFNQNTQVLRSLNSNTKMNIQMPGSNTNPDNYSKLFSEEPSEMKDFVLNYDLIMIKSCYPNSNIVNEKSLEKIHNQYNQIFDFFITKPNKKLIILTSPPLQPIMTKKIRARRALELANWLKGKTKSENIMIIDLFNFLADNNGFLKRKYRRFIPFDSHPNKKANKEISNFLAEFIAKL